MQRLVLLGAGVRVMELSGFTFVLGVDVTLDPKHVPTVARILGQNLSRPYSGTALTRSAIKERLHTLQRSPSQARERRWKVRRHHKRAGSRSLRRTRALDEEQRAYRLILHKSTKASTRYVLRG